MADNEEVEEKPKKNIMGIITVVMLTILIGISGFIAFQLMSKDEAAGKDDPAIEKPVAADVVEAPTEGGEMINLDDFTVNLTDEESKFLRTKISIDPNGPEAEVRINSINTKVKDLIITILSSKSFAEIKTAEGKSKLKEEIVFRLNRITDNAVRNVYFTDFVSQ